MPQMMIGIGKPEKQKLKIRVSATMNINQSKLKSTAHFATVFVKISWHSTYLLQSLSEKKQETIRSSRQAQ